eukprot:6202176-Pleurochrysis_carterae.AAC.2
MSSPARASSLLEAVHHYMHEETDSDYCLNTRAPAARWAAGSIHHHCRLTNDRKEQHARIYCPRPLNDVSTISSSVLFVYYGSFSYSSSARRSNHSTLNSLDADNVDGNLHTTVTFIHGCSAALV